MTMSIEKAIQKLANETKSTVIDLRYAHGSWCIMAPFGNTMWVVTGTVHDTPEAAIEAAMERWENRSPTKPFLSDQKLEAHELLIDEEPATPSRIIRELIRCIPLSSRMDKRVRHAIEIAEAYLDLIR